MNFDGERGRTLTKGNGREEENDANQETGREMKKDGIRKLVLDKVSGLLRLDREENKESDDGWKEFKKGRSLNPIFYALTI